jgi:hypothetical protein
MTKLGFVLVALLASAGCKKKGAPPPDCASAVFHSMELAKGTMSKQGVSEAMMQKLTDVGVQHCKDDKWNADAITCMTNAQTESAAQGCYDKLSKEQQGKMNAAAMEVISAAPAGSGSAATPAADGSGSAGSAASSGSAAAAGPGSAAAAGSGSAAAASSGSAGSSAGSAH